MSDTRGGLVIAGGRSTRFGDADKAVAPLAGVPMIRRVAEAIAPLIEHLVINCREDQRAAIENAMEDYPIPTRYRIDEEPDQGPVYGIATGLVGSPTTYTFVCACDMPFIEADIVADLFEAAEGSDGAIPEIDERIQPLHAVYHTSKMRDACEATLAADQRRIVHALERLECEVLEEADLNARALADSFANINTREELQDAASRFRE